MHTIDLVVPWFSVWNCFSWWLRRPPLCIWFTRNARFPYIINVTHFFFTIVLLVVWLKMAKQPPPKKKKIKWIRPNENYLFPNIDEFINNEWLCVSVCCVIDQIVNRIGRFDAARWAIAYTKRSISFLLFHNRAVKKWFAIAATATTTTTGKRGTV